MLAVMFLLIVVITTVSAATGNDKWLFVRRRLESSSRSIDDRGNSQWLPNGDKSGRGYNPAQGSPVCYTGDCQMNGFARPIFRLNYTKRTVGSCVDLFIPENVDIDCLSSTDSTSSTEVISTLRQFQESITKGIEIRTDASASFAGFSASFSYAHSQQTRSMVDTLVKESSTVLFTTLKISWVRLSLFEPKLQLSEDFRFVIENMPCCLFDAPVEEYVRMYIIGYFGYTYVNDLLLGGIAQQRTIITQSDRVNLQSNGWGESDEASLAVAATQIFSAAIKVKVTETFDQQKLEKFSRYTKQGRVTTLGGDISLQSFEDWSKTVKANPTIIKFGISLIFDLLTKQRFPNDPNITMKARLIQTTVEKYLLNPVYCYNQCTHPSQGTCVDSGYFRFGTCQCQNGWKGLDCSTETDDQSKEISQKNKRDNHSSIVKHSGRR